MLRITRTGFFSKRSKRSSPARRKMEDRKRTILTRPRTCGRERQMVSKSRRKWGDSEREGACCDQTRKKGLPRFQRHVGSRRWRSRERERGRSKWGSAGGVCQQARMRRGCRRAKNPDQNLTRSVFHGCQIPPESGGAPPAIPPSENCSIWGNV